MTQSTNLAAAFERAKDYLGDYHKLETDTDKRAVLLNVGYLIAARDKLDKDLMFEKAVNARVDAVMTQLLDRVLQHVK